MKNEISAVKVGVHSLQMSEDDLISVLTTSLYPGASINSIKMVLSYCKAAGLDPMQKPVHIVPMFDKFSKQMRDVVMPGIGLYRTQAALSEAYAGVTEPVFGEDVTEELSGVSITYPRWCSISIKRILPSGQIVEFSAKEFWKENYATAGKDSVAPNAMWRKRPYGQISKCAEAQALRKAFPEIGSAPTADEMEGKSLEEREINPSPPTRQEPEAYPEDKFTENLPKWRDLIDSGKKTAEQIVSMVSSKAILSDEQKEMIKTPRPGDVVDAEFAADMGKGETF